jgi:hypothetical protein
VIFLLTFSDICSSLECHKALKREGITCDIDNVPPWLGLSCGYAVRCEAPDVAVIEKTLRENNITCSMMIPIE